MTARRVLLGGGAVCGFLREAAVSFVNHPSVCVHVSDDEVPLSVIRPCLPKEPALQKGNKEGEKGKMRSRGFIGSQGGDVGNVYMIHCWQK